MTTATDLPAKRSRSTQSTNQRGHNAERALTTEVQRLLTQRQRLLSKLGDIERERSRHMALLDRAEAEMSSVLARLAELQPPEAKPT